jgi:hypothetical protein
VGRERTRGPGGQAEHAQQVAAALERYADKRSHFGIRQSHVALVLAHVLDLGGSDGRGYPAGNAETNRKPGADRLPSRHQRSDGDDVAVADQS